MSASSAMISMRQHMIFWACTFVLFLGFVWLFGDTLLPFVLGLAIAYLLEPLVQLLGKNKIPRWIAALIILGGFFVFVATVLMLIGPPLYREALQLANAMPDYADNLYKMVEPYLIWLQERFGNGDMEDYKKVIQQNIGKALNVGVGVVGGVLSSGQAAIGTISVLVLTPLTSYFMMKEWQNMTKWTDDLIPRGSYDTVKGLLHQINVKLSGFVRGQISVAFALAIIYALALTVAGLKFGFLIGIMAGVLSVIPLIGSTVGLVVSVLVAWFQSGEWSYVGIIAAIFLVGQFVEGNFLTPKLLGSSVGLHPLWILFALLAGGSLFGIVGMFLAVPVAAVVGVLLGFAIKQYRESPYYTDGEKKAPKKAKAKVKTKSKK